MKTYKELLSAKNNDFSNLEQKYFSSQGISLIFGNGVSSRDDVSSISVVIPSHNSAKSLNMTLEYLNRQTFARKHPKKFEIIVVDDGSTDETSHFLTVWKARLPNTLKVVSLPEKYGNAVARNRGVQIANNFAIVFCDSDMILMEDAIEQLSIRSSLLPEVCIVGFRETVNEKFISQYIGKELPKCDPSKDWRINTTSWQTGREVKILQETHGFKYFGLNRNIEGWTLPNMFRTCLAMVSKQALLDVGGLYEGFSGWGANDVFLGAKLIAHGLYVIPCLTALGYHIKHPPRSGSLEKRNEEFLRNRAHYEYLISNEGPLTLGRDLN